MEDDEKPPQGLKETFGGEVTLEFIFNKGINLLTPWVYYLYVL